MYNMLNVYVNVNERVDLIIWLLIYKIYSVYYISWNIFCLDELR